MLNNQTSNEIRIRVFAAGLLAAVCGSCLAAELWDIVKPAQMTPGYRLIWNIGLLVFFLVGTQMAITAATRILRFRTRRLNTSPAEPRRVLVWFLSELRGRSTAGGEPAADEGLPKHIELTWDLEADLARLAEDKRQRSLSGGQLVFWSWEQPLRGLHHNKRSEGPLQRLILICSHESVQQVHVFARLVRRYELLQDVSVEIVVPDGHGTRLVEVEDQPFDRHWGWNFDDFDEMWRVVWQVLEHLRGVDQVPDKDIAIDLTGGTKPATVVSATATINRDIRNQYVSTNPRDSGAAVWEYQVLDYDLILGSSSAGV